MRLTRRRKAATGCPFGYRFSVPNERVLPPGQIPREDFPRFGLTEYAHRFPGETGNRRLQLTLPNRAPDVLDDALLDLPRRTHRADFHCVTTWSKQGLEWGGVSFADFFAKHVAPAIPNSQPLAGVVVRAQDGYRTTLLLEDLMASDVMLADMLDGVPLSIAHGAPLRLVMPQHYGYKNLKHLKAIEFCETIPTVKRGPRAFLDHPRARVSHEERGRWFPGWFLRRLYRPLIPSTVRLFRTALDEHERTRG